MAIRLTQTVVELLTKDAQTFNESASNTIVLTSTVDFEFGCLSQLGTIRSKLGEMCLGSERFTDEQEVLQDNIVQIINLTQEVIDLGDELTNNINVVQSIITTGPFYDSVSNTLNLTQQVLDPQDFSDSLINLISLSQLVQNPIVESLLQVLTLVQFVADNPVNQLITLFQTVDDGTGPASQNQLLLNQTVGLNHDSNHSLQNNIVLNQSVGIEIETGENLECIYAPQVGTGSFPIEPVISKSPTMTLTWPFVSPTLTVTIRSPEFGNRDQLEYQRIRRETIGGELTIFRDPKWPQSQILTMEVLNICGDDLEDLLDFFKQSLGDDVGLLDYEGRQWKGIILTPEADKTEISKDRYSLSFEFQGELQ